MRDIGVFVEGGIAEMITPSYDAELEQTHTYALFILIIPGRLLRLLPFFKSGNELQFHPGGSNRCGAATVGNHCRTTRDASVTAYGSTSRGYGVRLPAEVNAEFFRRLPAARGFDLDSASVGSSSFTASRR